MKNAKLFGKINVFDFIVLVLVVLLVVASLGVFGLKSIKDARQGRPHKKEITYQISLESIRIESVNSFDTGTAVYSNSSKDKIGVITSIESKNAVKVMETLDGKVVSAPVEDRYNVTLTVRAAAKTEPDGDIWISASDRILEGQNLTFITQKIKCQGTVKNIEIKDDFGEMSGSFASFSEYYYAQSN